MVQLASSIQAQSIWTNEYMSAGRRAARQG